LCNVILEVDQGTVVKFEGNYTAWRKAKLAASAKPTPQKTTSQTAKPAKSPAPASKSAPAARANSSSPPSKSSSSPSKSPDPKKPTAPGKVRNPWAFEKLEKKIMTLEVELKSLQEALLTEDVWRDAKKLKESQLRAAEVERDLADANHEWENWG